MDVIDHATQIPDTATFWKRCGAATTERDYLLSKGVGDERMTVVGYGEAKPIADNATEEGRLQNRRVVMRRRDCDEPK
jgi:hypothetical protein